MKFKSYAFWTSLSAAVVVLVGVLANIFGFVADEKLVTDLIMAICGILVVFGIVKMPSKETTETEIETTDTQQSEKTEDEDASSSDKTEK